MCRVCVPLTPVLRRVIANINITTHGLAVSIATPSNSKSLHCLAELRLRQTKHFGVEQLVQESYTQILDLAWFHRTTFLHIQAPARGSQPSVLPQASPTSPTRAVIQGFIQFYKRTCDPRGMQASTWSGGQTLLDLGPVGLG